MRLRRLQLFGFKSFADRTELCFDHPLVGIVGPNGCGKSNVVDAIRWVLGEQRPTSMRGGEMSDVVFKGSVSRAAMHLAEVTLVLDNARGELAGRGSEVAITRRVNSAGEGEYLIDGEQVRLKDLRDMLFDTGLGSRGYAVLEQGRIDAVLSANPLDRRGIFEEAAGISRYRARRRESEARLKRVEEDGLRLDDVLRELTSRVRSLKSQAARAERYLAVREEWRGARLAYARLRRERERCELEALALRERELEARASELRRARESSEGEAAQREREQVELAGAVDQWTAELTRCAGEARAAGERASALVERAQTLERSSAEEAERAREFATALEQRRAECESAGSALLERLSELERARTQAQEWAERVRQARENQKSLRERSQAQNERVLGLLHERTQVQNSLRHLSEARTPAAERGERLRLRLDEQQRELAELEAALLVRHAGAQDAEQQRRRAAQALEVAQERLRAAESSLDSVRGERAQRELELARMFSRIEALREMEREQGGLEQGTRALLEDERVLQSGLLRGLLADRLRTSTRYARALDAVLGERALALCVDSLAVARELAGRLSDRGAKAILCWPASGAAAPALRSGDPEPEPSDEHVRERSRLLLDCVEVDEPLAELARAVLGGVRWTEDLSTAMELLERDGRWRYATAQGELLDRSSLACGARELAAGPVGRRASVRELEQQWSQGQAAHGELERALERSALEREGCAEALRQAEAEFRARAEEAAQAHSALALARGRCQALSEALGLVEREHAGAAEAAALLDLNLEREQERWERAEREFAEENARLSALEEQRREQERSQEEQLRAEGTVQRELARLEAERGGLELRCGDGQRAVEALQREWARAARLAQEHAHAAREAADQAERDRATAVEKAEQAEQASRKLEELRALEREGREQAGQRRRAADQWTRELEGLVAEQNTLQLEAQRIELARAELGERLKEEFGLADAQALEESLVHFAQVQAETPGATAGTQDLAALEQQSLELKRKLDQIGPVSLESVGELEENAKRLEFLESQRADLEQGRRSLLETLAAINAESTRLFTETFETVRGHFQILFRQLFGGGRADLSLEPGVDPLEAGIEISARPPGREMLPIGLLSGGQRTMTALALLFAVFRSRPSPFCVLDEVDAALDDVNVGRFLSMLDGFLAESHFVVVTHNKGTMAACQALYGITMEVKGVSNQVAVEFSQVDRFVPEATGNAAAAALSRASVAVAGNGESEEPDFVLAPRSPARASPAPRPDGTGQDSAPSLSPVSGAGDGSAV
jgi:chromosome segregation protein